MTNFRLLFGGHPSLNFKFEDLRNSLVEVRLGERFGIVPSDYLELLADHEVTSDTWGSTPSTPERPIRCQYLSHVLTLDQSETPITPERPSGVISERLFRHEKIFLK